MIEITGQDLVGAAPVAEMACRNQAYPRSPVAPGAGRPPGTRPVPGPRGRRARRGAGDMAERQLQFAGLPGSMCGPDRATGRLQVLYRPAGAPGQHVDLALNLYVGCNFGCRYCFGPGLMRTTRENYRKKPRPRAGVITKLERDCQRLQGAALPTVQLSLISDPYQDLEQECRLTRQALKLLKEHGFPVSILTKAGLERVSRDWDLLEPGVDQVGSTLTLVSPEASRRWEPGAALPLERLAVLQEARKRGFRTWAHLEPVISPRDSLQLMEQASPCADTFAVGRLNRHPHAATIDWARFADQARELLDRLGVDYYLMRSLSEAGRCGEEHGAPRGSG